jgi:replicative superfamily II helicase
VRARRLYNAGYTSVERLKKADIGTLTRILGQHLARQIHDGPKGVPKEADSGEVQNFIPETGKTRTLETLTDLPAIGKKMADKLQENGIHSVADLLNTEESVLAGIIGSKRAATVFSALKQLEQNETEVVNPDTPVVPDHEESDTMLRETLRRGGQQSFSDFL